MSVFSDAIDWVKDAIGGKKPPERTQADFQTPVERITGPDQSLYQYGGHSQYFKNQRNRLEAQEAAAQNRDAYQLDYRNAMADRAAAQQARGMQMNAAAQYQDVLSGKGPESLAQLQMRQGQQQAANQGMAMLASTQNLSPAQRARLANQQVATASSNNAAQASLLRAQEIEQARQGYAGLASTIRGADYNAAAQAAQMEQAQGQLEAAQRGLNDARSMGLLGAQQQMNAAKMQGDMAFASAGQDTQRFNAGAQNAAAANAAAAYWNERAREDERKRQERQGIVDSVIGIGTQVAGTAFGAPPGASRGGGGSGGAGAPSGGGGSSGGVMF